MIGYLLGEFAGEDVEVTQCIHIGGCHADEEVVGGNCTVGGELLDVVFHGALERRGDVNCFDSRTENTREGAVYTALHGAFKTVENTHAACSLFGI